MRKPHNHQDENGAIYSCPNPEECKKPYKVKLIAKVKRVQRVKPTWDVWAETHEFDIQAD